VQGEAASKEWSPERVLVKGPTVTRSFQKRAEAAKPELSAGPRDKAAANVSAKVSFISQCLQVCLVLLLRAYTLVLVRLLFHAIFPRPSDQWWVLRMMNETRIDLQIAEISSHRGRHVRHVLSTREESTCFNVKAERHQMIALMDTSRSLDFNS
jgi:hypothetical protein